MTFAHLEFDGISKEFPGVKALDSVSFGCAEGSVHALVGENGAGKSTLLKILSGAYAPSAGCLRLNGQPRVFRNHAQALAAGIAVIYQELHLVAELSVAENIFLGHLPQHAGILDRPALRRQALSQLKAVGEEGLAPSTPVGRLSLGQRQMVEIAKALTRGAKIIAFDEPTSSLSRREVQRLFTILQSLKAAGCVILYVSHRIEEIFEACDAVTVLRDGRHVETFSSMADVTPDKLIQRMVGRDIADVYHYQSRPLANPVLEVAGLSGPGLAEPASFVLRRGEILGIFGLVGAGRSELLQLIYGAASKSSGSVKLEGQVKEIRQPGDAIGQGMMLCPEDRKKSGIIPTASVADNLNLSARRNHTRAGYFIDPAWETANARAQINRLGIKTPSLNQLCPNLSGGNQQKVILARWLSEPVKVLLMDEPTRGIDVGAKSEVYSMMYQLAGQGVGIVMVSSDLPEVLGVADRIVVMRQGKIAASISRQEATPQKVMEYALPIAEAAAS